MRLFLILICFLCLSNCYQVERNCNDFKTGTFEFKYVIDSIEKTGRFVRTENLNIDYYDNKVDSATVRWINDCEFILKKINPKNRSEEKAIHMKILSTTNNSYTFEYKLAAKETNQKQRVERGSAVKIN
jgi:hypothetical protein